MLQTRRDGRWEEKGDHEEADDDADPGHGDRGVPMSRWVMSSWT